LIFRCLSLLAVWASLLGFACAARAAAPDYTPTGQAITPLATPSAVFETLNPHLPDLPNYTAGQASALALSPDGKTLLVLTSGFNRMFGADGHPVLADSKEYVFAYDVSGPAPRQVQVLPIADSFIGLAWAPSGSAFYVSGGVDDDVLEFTGPPGEIKAGRVFRLGHKAGVGLLARPEAGGLAVSPDGKRLLVTNVQNDSVSLVELETGKITERDLRPGVIDPAKSGEAGGTFPRAVAWTDDTHAYVVSERDRQIIALTLSAAAIEVGPRIATVGQPVYLLKGPGPRLYAALDNTDAALVIDTTTNEILESIPTAAPAALARPGLGGAGSNFLALSPDHRSLLVANGGENAVAVIALDALARGAAKSDADGDGDDDDDDDGAKGRAGPEHSAVWGLIPTGWYPTGVVERPDGRRLYIINSKSVPGPNTQGCRNTLSTAPDAELTCRAANQYVWQLEKAGLLTLPPPDGPTLAAATRQVALNDHMMETPTAADSDTMAFLHGHIRHVIYVVKENRTYDQVLGDLPVGDGDPSLALFGRAITPNQHAMALGFVDLDAFFDSGESSNTGWNWSLAGRTNDWTEREAPVNYAVRGLQYDQEGDNRNVNVGFANLADRLDANPLGPKDPNAVAGARDVAAPDAPGAVERGYLWDQALRAGLWVRNWGFYGDLALYEPAAGDKRTPLIRDPHHDGVKVFTPAKASLMNITDPYFRGFDNAFPDYWRFIEWRREFSGFEATGKAPALMMVRLMHDHTGDFGKGLDGVTNVETQLADNDYAVGLLVQTVARSRFAADTLIFVVEDDAQDGPDHVDAHRAPAYIVGPYVKHGAVVSRRYTTVNLLATMEAVLGIKPMGLNDALARPMTDVFDIHQATWTFDAHPSAALRTTSLPLPPETHAQACVIPQHSGAYWAAAMQGQDFSREDHLDTAAYNLALWKGMKGDAPYPSARDGQDMRYNRAPRLAAAALASCD
jgi:DNA-binding beta-propeller fold protein YncE